MCGLTGFVGGNHSEIQAENILQKMADKITHRGPDDEGIWYDEKSQIGLAHRRLAIIDLSPAGHQPMHSKSLSMVFNGEIYNHLEIRAELDKENDYAWKGHSDTETLLAGFEKWGIQETIKKTTGMFAIALWDHNEEKLYLIRDRLGEKPLYYGEQEGHFIFASELKSLKVYSDFSFDINRDALSLYLRHGYISAPYSIYKDVKKVLPGSMMVIDFKTKTQEQVEYWSAKKKSEGYEKDRFTGTREDAVAELETLLKRSIKEQMMSDVPLGAFLSGGVDSSTIIALMQAQTDKPVKSFTIGFNEEGYNEAVHASVVAKHLGTDHTEQYIKPEDALSIIPDLPYIYDEPFSDDSQIPTILVSRLAKEHVTVSLSGDAGDELFCGYDRYMLATNMWGKFSKIPKVIRGVIAGVMQGVPISVWNKFNYILPIKYKMGNLGDKMHKVANVLNASSLIDLYLKLISTWVKPEDVLIGGREPLSAITDPIRRPLLENKIEQMMAIDSLSYLPDDILAKVDRAAMSSSLETRVPFLNHKLVEFAWSLPLEYKLYEGTQKWCLKEVLYKYVPQELVDRPKMGFGVPIDVWLRGPLKEWADKLLDENRLKKEGFFHSAVIQKKWQEHLSGKRNWQYQLWSILMFQAWYEAQHK